MSSKQKALENAQLFVNRIDALEVVETAYDQLKQMTTHDSDTEEDYRIVNFYGVGGKGKSSLANKLIHDFKDKSKFDSEPLFIKWDASRSEGNTYALSDVLVHLRNQLVQKYNFQFPEFDKLVEQYNLISKTTPLFLEEYIDPDADSTVDIIKSAGKSIALNVADIFAGIGSMVASGVEIFDRFKERKRKRQKAEERAAFLSESITIEELEREMKYAFEIDYEACIKAIKQPVIIFIDTFEDIPYKLGSLEAGHLYKWLISGSDDEDYGFGLIHSLAKTLWVICGRDQIDDRDEDWSDSLFRSYKLNNLDEYYTKFFLTDKCKLEEQSIIEDIWQETEGNPLLLRIYYDLIKEDEEFLEKYHENKMLIKEKETDALVRVFLRYLYFDQNTDSNSEQGKLFRILIALGEWTKEEFFHFYRQMDENSDKLTDFSETEIAFDLITGKSIVHAEAVLGEEVYHFERMFQDTIFDAQYNNVPVVTEETKRRVLEFLSGQKELRDGQLRQMIKLSLALSNTMSEAIDYLSDYVHDHLLQLKKRGEYERYFRLKIESLLMIAKSFPQESGSLNPLVREMLREQINTYVFSLVYLNEELCSVIDMDDATVLVLSDYYLEIGYYKESANILKQSIHVMDTLQFDQYRLHQLNLLETEQGFATEVISTFGQKMLQQPFARDVEELHDQFYLIVNLIISEIQAEHIAAAKQYGFYLNILLEGKKEQFIELYLKSMLYLYRTDFENETPADTLFFVNELLNEQTIPLFIGDSRALRQLSGLSRKLLDDSALVGQGFRDAAGKISDLLLEVGMKRGLFGRNLLTATVFEDCAYVNIFLNQFERVEPLIDETMKIRGEILGEEHPKIVELLILKGMYHYRENRLEEAENILLPILEKKAILETLSETSLAKLYQYVGMLKLKQKDYEEATTFFKKADEKLTELYGREHWKAVMSHAEYLHSTFVSLIYEEQVQQEEVLKLARKIQAYCDFLEEKDVQTTTTTFYDPKTGKTEEKEFRFGNNLVVSANNSQLLANVATLLKCDVEMLKLQNENDYFDELNLLLDRMNRDLDIRDDWLNDGIKIGFTLGYLAILYYVYENGSIQMEFIEKVYTLDSRRKQIENEYLDFIRNYHKTKINKTFFDYSIHRKDAITSEDVVALCTDYMTNGMVYSMDHYISSENFQSEEEFYSRGLHICFEISHHVAEFDLFFRYLVLSALEKIVAQINR